MKVLIADDEVLSRQELSYMIKDNPLVDTILEADSAENTAKQVAANKDLDLVFLDIQLGDGNGISLGKEIDARGGRPRVVFATAYDQYALEAFDANAVDYLLKPFEQSRVDSAIKRVARSLQVPGTADKNGQVRSKAEQRRQQHNPRLSITVGDKIRIINKNQLIYAAVEDGLLTIQTEKQQYLIKQTMNRFAKLLDPQTFLRVHRAYVVNLNQVRGVEPSFNHTYELTMSDGSKVPVSRSYLSDLKEALGM